MNPRLRVTTFAAVATVLGSLSLLPIYDSYGWLPRVVLVVAVVATTSALAQRVRALVVAAPLLMVAAVTLLVTLLYAHQVAPLGFIPGPAALRLLHQTLSDGFSDTTQLAAPVPITRGLSLLTTGGIGLVAVVVETLATGLRRPAVVGLPLLAIFTVPAAILDNGVGWQPFVFGAAGYLALLLAEGRDRITRWGRPVRAQRAPRPTTGGSASGPRSSTAAPGNRQPAGAPRPAPFGAPARSAVVTTQLTQLGRRVGAAAIGVAVVVPVIIPGLHSGWFGTHHTAGAGGLGPDGSGSTSINPIVSMRRDLNQSTPVSLFSYTTTGSPQYLRMITLDKFDGTQWTPAAVTSPDDQDAAKELPLPAGLSLTPAKDVTTNVTITGLKEPYLPVPMVPTAVKAHGDWLYNPVTSVIYSKHSSTVHLKYEVTNAVYDPTESMLNTVVDNANDPAVSAYLAVPAHLPAIISTQADAVVAAAHATTAYQVAVALQNWFQANFVYDVNAKSGSDASALVSFLQDRTGYCEQFAATMALMARLEGIPSRVDVGFTPGTKMTGSDSSYLVTTADAHAWPELYFSGIGWLRFEPTPRSDGQTTRPAYSTATAAAPANPTASTPSSTVSGSAGAVAPNHDPRPNVGLGASGLPAGNSGMHVPIGWLVVLFLLLVAASSSPAVRWRIRRRRWTTARTDVDRAHAAWQELGDDLRDLNLEWRGASDTPRRAAAALIATRRLHYDTHAQQALSRLAQAEELARYASPASIRLGNGNPNGNPDGNPNGDPRADERIVRSALYESVPRSRRIRARLAPPSTGRIFATAASDAIEAARAWGRRLGAATLAKLPARAR